MSGHTIWAAFGKAVGAELREDVSIQGVSGLTHQVDAICVDDKGDRVIVVSAEPNPRVAALMQGDIQQTLPGKHVIVARPIPVDLPAIARGIAANFGTSHLDLAAMGKSLDAAKEKVGEEPSGLEAYHALLDPIAASFKHLNLPPLNQILAAVQQMAMLDWKEIENQVKTNPAGIVVPLANLLTTDSAAIDRQHGICPLPLYEFTEGDWDLFLAARDKDAIEERLKALGIHQYFFPSPDQVALGLVDRRRMSVGEVNMALKATPAMGHPFSPAELMPDTPVNEIVDHLTDLGYLVEGEVGLEVTSEGTSTRATVKFRPREGLVSKLLQRFNLNVSVSPKDFL